MGGRNSGARPDPTRLSFNWRDKRQIRNRTLRRLRRGTEPSFQYDERHDEHEVVPGLKRRDVPAFFTLIRSVRNAWIAREGGKNSHATQRLKRQGVTSDP